MNPLFPLNEYIPDGEAHVFNHRVYLYGSHDKENGNRFCIDDYKFYSCDINDLTNWKSDKISYRKINDPRSTPDKLVDFYAPDCVKGNDNKYYLYYFIAGPNVTPFRSLSVASSDSPDGPFTYLSDIKYKDGTIVDDFLTNDPAVINDNGHIYLYYGWGFPYDFRCKLLSPLFNFVLSKITRKDIKTIKSTIPSILSCAFVELESDMFTIKDKPIAVLDSKTTANKKDDLYNHPFYEAASIRKIKDTYYLVYSSGINGELCYATSKFPDRDFKYRGVIIAANDIGYNKNKKPLVFTDTNHGSIEFINGLYYIFYHRLTRNTNFSRQVCCERIKINDDGSINQVEVTSSGISDYLIAKGTYSACIACNYFYRNKDKIKKDNHCVMGKNNDYFVGNIKNNGIIGFKYFNFEKQIKFAINIKGDKGLIKIYNDYKEKELATINIDKSNIYQQYSCNLNVKGIKPLYIEYIGRGKIDIKDIDFKEYEN